MQVKRIHENFLGGVNDAIMSLDCRIDTIKNHTKDDYRSVKEIHERARRRDEQTSGLATGSDVGYVTLKLLNTAEGVAVKACDEAGFRRIWFAAVSVCVSVAAGPRLDSSSRRFRCCILFSVYYVRLRSTRDSRSPSEGLEMVLPQVRRTAHGWFQGRFEDSLASGSVMS